MVGFAKTLSGLRVFAILNEACYVEGVMLHQLQLQQV